MKIWEVLKKCQNYRVFYIFWDILDKMKNNLGQECVKEGPLSFQGKIGTISLDFPGKVTVFLALTLLSTFHLPKICHSHPNKNYIFKMSNNRAICQKSFVLLSLNLSGPGGLRGPDGQTHSCQSETSYPMMPKLGDF